MARTFTTAVAAKKAKRDAKVCALFEQLRPQAEYVTPVYREIARKMGIALSTVVVILQKNNKI